MGTVRTLVTQHSPARLFLILAALSFAALSFAAGQAFAQNNDGRHDHAHHDHGHHDHGHHGQGHDKWHAGFYQKLTIPGSKTSCCNLSDCRPTQIRSSGDHYEIMKDGRWIRVAPEKIVKDVAPDGGPHICAPDSANRGFDPDYIFCIVMPLES